MAAEQGLKVDRDGFVRLMDEQRQRAKADAKAKKGGHANTEVWKDLRALGATDWRAYEELTTSGSVVGLVRDGSRVEELEPGQTGQVVLDRTSFYAESGGQIADEGIIVTPAGRLKVVDVQRPVKGLIAHTVEVLDGPVRVGEGVQDVRHRRGAGVGGADALAQAVVVFADDGGGGHAVDKQKLLG